MITFVNVFLMTEFPWIGIDRGDDMRAYNLTKSSLARLVLALKDLPGYFNIDNVGWTWTREDK